MEFDGKRLEGKSIFLMDETKMDTDSNTSRESVGVSSKKNITKRRGERF